MSIPSLNIFHQGGSPVSSDQFNTFLQTCDDVAQLRGFPGLTGIQTYMRGYVDPGDGGQGNFYWNATSFAVDDGGVTTITPSGYGVAPGRWVRLPGSGSSGGSGTVTSVSVNNTNGISGSVLNPTTTPFITLSLGAITPISVFASGTILGSNLSGTNTGDQTIALSGDVTGTGTGSFATTIGPNKVSYSKIQQVSAMRLLGNATGAMANLQEIPLGAGLAFSGGALTATTSSGSTINVMNYGATGNGSTDDTSAFNLAIAALLALPKGGVLYMPAGTYLLSSQLTITQANSTQSIVLKGDAPELSKMFWTNSSGGIAITFASGIYSACVGAEALTFRTQVANGGVGLSLTSTNTPNPGPVKRIFNCVFDGNHAGTYWTQGVLTDGCTYLDVLSCRFDGFSTGGTYFGTGIRIQNSQTAHAVGHYFSQCYFWNIGTGIAAGPKIEGISVCNCGFLGGIGVNWVGSVGEPSLIVECCDIDANIYGIVTQNITQETIMGNLFYVEAGATGIFINDSSGFSTFDANMIANNQVLGLGSQNGNGIVMTEAAYSMVANNIVSNLTTGIWLQAGTSNNVVQGNLTSACTTAITNSGTGNIVTVPGGGNAFRGAMSNQSSGQSLPNSSSTVVSFNTTTYDTSGFYNAGTPTRLTVPAGVSYVRVSGSVSIPTSSGYANLTIHKNGSGFPGTVNMSIPANSAGTNNIVTSTAVVAVSSGDYFECLAFQNSGGSVTMGGSSNVAWFSIEVLQ